MECDNPTNGKIGCVGNFNSRTHVECDRPQMQQLLQDVISTHALTWSATDEEYFEFGLFIFQLTHSRGVRRHHIGNWAEHIHFNSRTHVECDWTACKSLSPFFDFNSRTHVECDPKGHMCAGKRNEFQLTHSRGVRQQGEMINDQICNFNSRTHVECDFAGI